MTLYNSVQYAAMATLGVFGDGRDHNTKAKLFPFDWAAVATAGPTVNLCQVPKGFKPKLLYFQCEALSASGGVGLNVRIGDGGDGVLTADDDRLMADLDCDAAHVPGDTTAANLPFCGLALTGANIEYSADTLIVATITSGKTPVAGKKITGFILGSVDG